MNSNRHQRNARSVVSFVWLAGVVMLLTHPVFADFTITTLNSPNPQQVGQFSWSVSGAGDVNGDGHDDVVVGAPYEDDSVGGEGRVYIFSGADGHLLFTLSSLNPEGGGRFGNSVSTAGDVNPALSTDAVIFIRSARSLSWRLLFNGASAAHGGSSTMSTATRCAGPSRVALHLEGRIDRQDMAFN